MVYIRSVVYFLFLVASIAIFAPLIVLSWPLRIETRSAIATLWSRLNLRMLKSICGLDYRVHGLEHLASGNAIVFSKHQSAWETISLLSIIPVPQVWVLKKELLWVPIFGWAVLSMDPIAIDRKSGRRAVKQIVEKGVEMLKAGRWVVIFPEGTRIAPGQRKRFGIGGPLLAERSGFPVVPIAHNAGVFWPRRGLRKHPGVIDVVIGPPMSSKGLVAEEIRERAEHWIGDEMSKLCASRDPGFGCVAAQ